MYRHFTTVLQTLLPSWLYQRLIGDWDQHGFKKYFANTGWIFIAKIVTLVVSFFTLAVVARYLGPENYGKLSYAQSFVGIFSIFATLGIDQILYRDLIAHPEKEREILGTAFIAKLFFGGLTFITTGFFAWYLNNDIILTWLIGIIALSFIFQPFGVLTLLFQARVAAKYSSYVAILISIVIPIAKLSVIFLKEGILYFAAIIALEALINMIANLYIYVSVFKGTPFTWQYSSQTLRSLLLDSWPLLLAGFSAYLYGRIDQVMIQHAINSSAVGIYDAAVKLSEIWGFFPGVFIASLFPAIINARTRDHREYIKRFWTLGLFSVGLAGVIASAVFIFAPLIIALIFGPQFIESSSVLRIYIWSLVGAISVTLIQSYLIAENKAKKILVLTALGALANILLNTWMIPLYGIYGAAWATLLSYALIIGLFLITERRIFLKLGKRD
jgi:O-antigen/teichoic acid export membrane protein